MCVGYISCILIYILACAGMPFCAPKMCVFMSAHIMYLNVSGQSFVTPCIRQLKIPAHGVSFIDTVVFLSVYLQDNY